MKKLIITTMVVFSIFSCSKYSEEKDRIKNTSIRFHINDCKKAPEVGFPKIINSEISSMGSLSEIKGKVIVIEFWSTTCKGCVDSIPHINELSEKFKDKVFFISATKEDEDKIKNFIKNKKIDIKTPIALESKEAFEKFNVSWIPRTIVIDTSSCVALETYPSVLDESTLKNIIEGKQIEKKEDIKEPSEGTKLFDQNLLSYFHIEKTNNNNNISSSFSDNYFEYKNMQLKDIIKKIFNAYDVIFTDVPTSISESYYNIAVKYNTTDRKIINRFIALGLENGLGIKINIKKAQKDVFIIKKSKDFKLKPMDKYGELNSSYSDKLEIKSEGWKLNAISDYLSSYLRTYIVDEIKDDNLYKYNLKINSIDIKNISDELKTQIGLEFVKEKREVIIVEVKG